MTEVNQEIIYTKDPLRPKTRPKTNRKDAHTFQILEKPPIIKYIVLRDDGTRDISYSQIHDEYNSNDTKQTINDKIQKDLKFYKNSLVQGQVKIYVNNEFLKEVSL